MFPVSSGLTQSPMLNPVLCPLNKEHVDSPLKCILAKHINCTAGAVYKFRLFTHVHKVHNSMFYVLLLTETTISKCTRGRIHRKPLLEDRCPSLGLVVVVGLGMCSYDNLLLRLFHLLKGWHHVLVSDKVSNITSLSYISHSRVKESRRGVSSIILS